MEPLKMAKQMIDFNKATFDNAFNAMVLLQEQTEKMTKDFVGRATSLPDEGTKTLNEWIQTIKKGRDEFKKVVDESFNKVEAFFTEACK